MIRSIGTPTFRRALIVIVAAGLLVVATPTLAGRGGRNGGSGGRVQPLGTEVCWVDPNPVSDGEIYTVQGNGFKPGQALIVSVGGGSFLMATADSTGSFSTWKWAAFRNPGSVDVNIYQEGDRKMTVLTTCTLQANGM